MPKNMIALIILMIFNSALTVGCAQFKNPPVCSMAATSILPKVEPLMSIQLNDLESQLRMTINKNQGTNYLISVTNRMMTDSVSFELKPESTFLFAELESYFRGDKYLSYNQPKHYDECSNPENHNVASPANMIYLPIFVKLAQTGETRGVWNYTELEKLLLQIYRDHLAMEIPIPVAEGIYKFNYEICDSSSSNGESVPTEPNPSVNFDMNLVPTLNHWEEITFNNSSKIISLKRKVMEDAPAIVDEFGYNSNEGRKFFSQFSELYDGTFYLFEESNSGHSGHCNSGQQLRSYFKPMQ